MSIMQRDSPVNLSYKVVIVTNASSPVGVVVCKTLLKANALVLGTDTKNKDDSLTASAYSHFQFSPCSLTDDGAAEFLIAEVRKKFNTQRLDALVNLQRGEDSVEMQRAHRRLMDTCIQAMEAGDGGSIVNCTMQAADLGMNDLREQHIGPPASLDKVRCNKIANGGIEQLQPCLQYTEAQEHFEFLFKPASHRTAIKQSIEMRAMFEFSNVVLFLASELSRNLAGAVLNRHGGLVE